VQHMNAARAMLSLALVAFAAGEKRSPVELVLSRGDGVEDSELSWVGAHTTDARVTLYSKGRQPSKSLSDDVHEVSLTNVGQEAHSFLTHIVKNYDSLAEKTIFMPAAKPLSGFNGFQRGAANLLPGVSVTDYTRSRTTPLFVPTMAVSPDLKQTSVRMSFMDNSREEGLPKGRNFTACSGTNNQVGWSPLLPNKFGSSVLEPLMKAQAPKGAEPSFERFWTKHLPETPMPKLVMYSLNSAISVARDQILTHPKGFYEALLEEVSGEKNPYQAYFLEYMWWYIFNGKSASLCPTDQEVAAPARNHTRKLAYQDQIVVLEPHTGQQIHFGDTVQLSWAVGGGLGAMQIQLFRYGNFETTLASNIRGTSFNWNVYPGPRDETKSVQGRPWNANPSLAADWNQHYILHPDDKFTIRVCPIDINNIGREGPSGNTDVYYCNSDPYGESGEFDILPTIDVQMPAPGFVHTIGQSFDSATGATPFLPVSWTSYYTDGSSAAMTVNLINAATGYTVQSYSTTSIGYYNLHLPPDTPTANYIIEIVGTTTASVFGTSVVGRSGVFTINSAVSPPPSPGSPPSPPPPPNAPFELPIIKAFRSQFGMDTVTEHSGAYHDYSTMSTSSGGNNCEYVCRVYRTVGTGRRLLFGGLQYSGASTQIVGCTPAQIACNCCNRG